MVSDRASKTTVVILGVSGDLTSAEASDQPMPRPYSAIVASGSWMIDRR